MKWFIGYMMCLICVLFCVDWCIKDNYKRKIQRQFWIQGKTEIICRNEFDTSQYIIDGEPKYISGFIEFEFERKITRVSGNCKTIRH